MWLIFYGLFRPHSIPSCEEVKFFTAIAIVGISVVVAALVHQSWQSCWPDLKKDRLTKLAL